MRKRTIGKVIDSKKSSQEKRQDGSVESEHDLVRRLIGSSAFLLYRIVSGEDQRALQRHAERRRHHEDCATVMAHQVTREYEIFVILVDGNFQTVRAEREAAFEVRDNFNEMLSKPGRGGCAQVVRGVITYNPQQVISENE